MRYFNHCETTKRRGQREDAEDNMYSILISAVIIPLISYSMVLGGLLSISFLQLPTIRKNMRM